MLKLSNITKIYNEGTVNENVLFNKFSLEVKKGEFVSVVGSNGSGKTTMLNVICGCLEIEGGSVIIADSDVTKSPDFKRYKNIGRVYQHPAMGTCPNMTILENLSLADNKGKSYGLKFGTDKKKINLYRELLLKLNMGLEDKLYVSVGSLSGGQRQALALLMATMAPIEFLILDEHTAALDPKAADRVMELTDMIVSEKNITTIMVTHNLRYAVEYGSRLIMMHEGKAILDINDIEKKNTSIDDLLEVFNKISIECGN